jgi:hypothetical protein
VLGSSADTLLAPLRELRPEMDTFASVPASSLVRMHMDPEQPTPGGGQSALLDELPQAARDRLIEVAGADAQTTLFLTAELRQLGGALSRPRAGGGSLGRIDGQFQFITGGFMLGDAAKQTIEDCRRNLEAMAPWSRGRQYLNFQEDPVDPATGFDPEAWAKLVAIRQEVDPERLFRANHEIG